VRPGRGGCRRTTGLCCPGLQGRSTGGALDLPPVAGADVDCVVLQCVALTVDDGPGPHAGRLLDDLRAGGVRAAFCVVGRNVERGWSARGHGGLTRSPHTDQEQDMTDQSAAHPADHADALQSAPSDGATACAAVLGTPGADRSGVVEELRGVVAGPVLTPADDGFADEVATFDLAVRYWPRISVGATSVDDVTRVLAVTGRHGLRVAVLGTGHAPVGRAATDVLLTLRRMADVTVDTLARTATVGPGAT
jgi:hypothetical protein